MGPRQGVLVVVREFGPEVWVSEGYGLKEFGLGVRVANVWD